MSDIMAYQLATKLAIIYCIGKIIRKNVKFIKPVRHFIQNIPEKL